MTDNETNELEALAAVYGPQAPYSEHKRGEHVVYRDDRGQRRQGEVLYVCAPGSAVQGRDPLPLRYVVAPDSGDFPEVVYPQQIEEEKA